MPTANELFRDELLRRQVYLQRFGSGTADSVIRTLNDTESDIRIQLSRRLGDLAGSDFDRDATSRLRVLGDALGEIRKGAWQDANGIWTDRLQKLALDEAEYLSKVLTEVSPVRVNALLPDARDLANIVNSRPFDGRTMKEWSSTIARADLDRMMRAIKIGMVQGDDPEAMARRVVGSASLRGANGVTEVTRNGARSLTRTAVNHVSNESRGDFYEANDDVFEEEVFVATLDSKTTPICRSLDGNRYKIGEGPIPPLHWGCRSVRVALISDELIGERPAAAWSEEMLEGLDRDERRAKIRELTGPVPARTTYAEFLKDQTEDFQDDVLGPARAELFRSGEATLDGFVDQKTFRPLTLNQINARLARQRRRR